MIRLACPMSMLPSPAAARRAQPAQSVVELALILPVFLIMLLGMFDIGRAFVFGVAVQNGAREAARLGSQAALVGANNDAAAQAQFERLVLQRLIHAPALSGCQAVSGTQPSTGCPAWVLTVSPSGTKASGAAVTVTAVGRPSIFAGFMTGAMSLSLPQVTVHGQAIMEIL